MTQPILDYRDLVAWQRAMDLAVLVDEICDQLPKRQWKLASQMRGAANSVHANIAEGNGRFSSADYLRHLGMSNASLNELESDLHFVGRRHAKLPKVQDAMQLTIAVRKPLWGLVKSIQDKKDNET